MEFLLKWDHIGCKCLSEMLSCKLLFCPAWLSPLKIRLKWQPPTFMPIQSVSPRAVVYFSFRFLCRSWTVLQHLSLGIANQPHVYTAATLTWCHMAQGCPNTMFLQKCPTGGFLLETSPYSASLLTHSQIAFHHCPHILLPLSTPSCFSFQGPFLWKWHNFPLGQISKQGLAVVPGIPPQGAVGGEKK